MTKTITKELSLTAWVKQDRDQTQMRYCGRNLPRQPIPAGRFLVHNQVIPEAMLGMSGFRAWTQNTRKGLVRCHCDFGGCKNAELHKHYRVQFGDNTKERRAYRAANAATAEFMKNAKPVKDFFAWQKLREAASKASGKAYAKAMRGG